MDESILNNMNCHLIIQIIQDIITLWICASVKSIPGMTLYLIDMQSCNMSKLPTSHHSGIRVLKDNCSVSKY